MDAKYDLTSVSTTRSTAPNGLVRCYGRLSELETNRRIMVGCNPLLRLFSSWRSL